jgi:hypothetical protein
MEHDDALADCWQRWQFVGDAMRGQAGRALPADFSRRVGRAIADDLADDLANDRSQALVDGATDAPAIAAQGGVGRPLLRWGGGAALAASVALAALIGTRDPGTTDGPAPAATTFATVSSPAGTADLRAVVPVPDPVLPPAAEAPVVDAAAALALAAVATTDRRGLRPRILAREEAVPASVTRQSSVTELPAATSPSRPGNNLRSADSVSVASADTATQGNAAAAGMTPKPWPRALVPGAAVNGEVTAGFGGDAGFHSLQPLPPRFDPLPANSARPAEDAAPSP